MKTMLPIMVLVSSLVGSASAIEPIPSLANPGIKRIPMGMNRPSVNSYPYQYAYPRRLGWSLQDGYLNQYRRQVDLEYKRLQKSYELHPYDVLRMHGIPAPQKGGIFGY